MKPSCSNVWSGVTLAFGLAALWRAEPAVAQRIVLPVKVPELESRAKEDSTDPAAHYT